NEAARQPGLDHILLWYLPYAMFSGAWDVAIFGDGLIGQAEGRLQIEARIVAIENLSAPKDSAAKAQVVGFPVVPPEEVKRRALGAAQDLARSDRPAGEWKLYYVDIAGRYGIPPAEFAAVIEEIIAQRKKQGQEAKAQDREREQRVERERITARREQK